MRTPFLALLFLITLLALEPAFSLENWWDGSWGYRMPITITNGGGALADYQVNITLDTASLISAGKMRSDCGDLRFANSSDESLSYWVESGCNTASTKVRIKDAHIPGGSSAIYAYYGKPSATSASNGAGTFEFFDDFSDFSINRWAYFPQDMPYYDHGGADWAPANGDAYDLDPSGQIGIAGMHSNISTFTVASGTAVYVYGYNGSHYGRLYIFANNATIAGTLSGTGRGYAGGDIEAAGSGPGAGGPGSNWGNGGGGAGYGGRGGNGYCQGNCVNYGGITYGSLTEPLDMGSGGGGGMSGAAGPRYGGAGGGAIRLNILDTLSVNGSIQSNGAIGGTTGANAGAGSGSGGSIWITADTLTGSGSVQADGGCGGGYGCGTWAGGGGGGGGGRIAAYYSNNTFTGTLSANGGIGNSNGEAGTVHEGPNPWSAVSGELKGTTTAGRLQSSATFGTGAVLEAKSRYTALPTDGYQVVGFFIAESNSFGYLSGQAADYYISDGNLVVIGAAVPPSTGTLTRIYVKSPSSLDLYVAGYDTGVIYHNIANIANNVSNEPISIGRRYDRADGNQSYEAYWDWMLVRKYAPPEPAAIRGAEQAIPKAPPTITLWSNNKTNSQALTIAAITSEPISFSATANQQITAWTWLLDGANQSNNYGSFTASFTAGTHNVSVSASNANGTSNTIAWTIVANDTLPEVPIPPTITSWTNSKTNDQSLSVAVSSGEPVSFMAIADQAITAWNWFKDGIGQGISSGSLATNFTMGNHTLSVTSANANGISNRVAWGISSFPQGNITPVSFVVETDSAGMISDLDGDMRSAETVTYSVEEGRGYSRLNLRYASANISFLNPLFGAGSSLAIRNATVPLALQALNLTYIKLAINVTPSFNFTSYNVTFRGANPLERAFKCPADCANPSSWAAVPSVFANNALTITLNETDPIIAMGGEAYLNVSMPSGYAAYLDGTNASGAEFQLQVDPAATYPLLSLVSGSSSYEFANASFGQSAYLKVAQITPPIQPSELGLDELLLALNISFDFNTTGYNITFHGVSGKVFKCTANCAEPASWNESATQSVPGGMRISLGPGDPLIIIGLPPEAVGVVVAPEADFVIVALIFALAAFAFAFRKG